MFNFKMVGVITLVSLLVIGYLKYQLQTSEHDRKQAELNTQLVVSEFDTLYKSNQDLKEDYENNKEIYQYNMQLLQDKHKQDLKLVSGLSKITTEIKNVTKENDGEIANVLSDTLNSLRMLK